MSGGTPIALIDGSGYISQINGSGYVIDTINFSITPYDPLSAFPNQATTAVIPSYLYWEYQTDPACQAFVDAFNGLAQEYVDWFNSINLPVYAGNNQLVGNLLDWVLTGLYGQPRPVLPSTQSRALGPYNTETYNALPYNGYRAPEVTQVYITTDDVYKRIATWNLYRGDGYTFNVRWLKRRIQRFLTGVNGVDGSNPVGIGLGVDQTYSVSVTFSANNVVNVTVNTTDSGTLTIWDTLKAAIESGAVNLPFQYTWNLV